MLSIQTSMLWCYGCDTELLDPGAPEDAEGRVSELAPELRGIVAADAGAEKELLPQAESKEVKEAKGDGAAVKPASVVGSGRCGLANLGNTCFMNAMIQALSNVQPFSRVSAEVPPASIQAYGGVTEAFSRVMTEVWSGRYRYVSPDGILRSLRRVNPMFEGYSQHDAQEALRYVLMDIHEKSSVGVPLAEVPHYVTTTSESAAPVAAAGDDSRTSEATTTSTSASSVVEPTKPPAAATHDARAWLHDGPYTGPSTMEQSIVSDLFRGTLTSTVRCRACGFESHTRDHFYDLSLSIPKRRPSAAPPDPQAGGFSSAFCRLFGGSSIRLIDCLYQFCASEALVGRDQYLCERCKGHQDADKTMRISQLPEVLVIHLKRFNYGSMWGSKIGTSVSFPMTDLDMSPFMAAASGVSTASSVSSVLAAGAGAGAGPVTSPSVVKPAVAMSPRAPGMYDLVSIVEHMGGLHGGHYIAFGRGVDGEWSRFDDSRVSSSSATRVARQEAYLLVYQRRHEPVAVPKPLGSEGKTAFCYVSKYWWIKRGTCASPGPASAAVLMCDHNNVKGQLVRSIKDMVVGLTRSQWEWVSHQYGSTRVLMSLSGCVACKREQDALAARRDREKLRIREQDTSQIGGSECWYIISESWLEKWRQFIDNRGPSDGTGRGALPPGPISNHTLLRKDGKPFPNLRKIRHYRGVNVNVWTFLHGIYRGGPIIKRKQLDIYDDPVDRSADATAAGNRTPETKPEPEAMS